MRNYTSTFLIRLQMPLDSLQPRTRSGQLPPSNLVGMSKESTQLLKMVPISMVLQLLTTNHYWYPLMIGDWLTSTTIQSLTQIINQEATLGTVNMLSVPNSHQTEINFSPSGARIRLSSNGRGSKHETFRFDKRNVFL